MFKENASAVSIKKYVKNILSNYIASTYPESVQNYNRNRTKSLYKLELQLWIHNIQKWRK